MFLCLAVASASATSIQGQNPAEEYERACDGGALIDCAVLGLIYQTGAAGARDVDRAIELYERACRREVASACRRLELMEESATTRPSDDERVRVGYVADAYDGAPLGGALVRIAGVPGVGDRRYVSDAAGRVVLEPLPIGEHRIEVQRGGYASTAGDIPVPWRGDFLILMEAAREEEEATTGRLFGQITDQGSSNGISDVDVTLLGDGAARSITNQDGRFLIPDVEPGRVRVRIERIGYEPREVTVEVEAGRTVELYASLTAEPIELEPVEVSVSSRYLERSGFYRRMQTASGEHFTFRDIERLNAMVVADIVRRSPGVSVLTSQVGTGSEALSSRRRGGAMGRCRLRPYFNGVPTVDFNLELVPPDEIEALEVYQGANVPIEFLDEMQRAGASCGVVLIWTRDPARTR
jgi:hypothetical protein